MRYHCDLSETIFQGKIKCTFIRVFYCRRLLVPSIFFHNIHCIWMVIQICNIGIQSHVKRNLASKEPPLGYDSTLCQLKARILKNKNIFFYKISTNLDNPDVWNIVSGLYPLPSYAFHTPLYIIAAEVEINAFRLILLVVDHHTNTRRECGAFVVLNNLCETLLLGNNLLGKASLQ